MLGHDFFKEKYVMSIETIDKQISKQQERLKQMKAQKQAVIARQKAKVTKQQRTDDTRRKILIGAYMQDMFKTNDQAKILMNGLQQWLKEDRDSKLFEV
jgi:hypothetical protein